MRRVCCRIRCMLRIHGLLAARHKGNESASLNLSASKSKLQRNSSAFCREIKKFGCIPLKIARNRRNSAILVLNMDWRKCPIENCREVLRPFSLKGTHTVRFQGPHRANAMRPETEDVAKGT